MKGWLRELMTRHLISVFLTIDIDNCIYIYVPYYTSRPRPYIYISNPFLDFLAWNPLYLIISLYLSTMNRYPSLSTYATSPVVINTQISNIQM